MADIFDPTSNWGQCYAHFLQSLRMENTRYRYRLILEKFFSEPKKSPELYTRGDVESFIHRSMISARSGGKPLAPSAGTVNFRLSALISFYKFSSTFTVEDEHGGIPRPLFQQQSPTAGIQYRKVSRVHRTLSESEIDRLFSVIPDSPRGLRDRALFLFYFWSLRRLSEVARLTWGDLAFATVRDKDGKTREAWVYSYIGKGKGNERQVIELPEEAKIALDAYLIASGRMSTMQADSPLFASRKGQGGITPSQINRLLKDYARKASIDTQRVSTHVWRHSGAQQRYLAGQDILSLKDVLGHVSLETTYIYLQSLVSTSDPGARLLSAKFGYLSRR